MAVARRVRAPQQPFFHEKRKEKRKKQKESTEGRRNGVRVQLQQKKKHLKKKQLRGL